MSNRDEQLYRTTRLAVRTDRMFENGAKMMYRGLLVFVCMFLLFSCAGPRDITQTTEKEKIEIVYKDSIRYFDSTVIIPVERYVDVVRDYDTLTLETSQAVAKAWVDSIFLKGEIVNKSIVQYKYIDKWHTITNDSIIYKDKIDYVETIKYVKNPVNKVTATISVVFFLMLLFFILRTFLK